jgi:hypothetical protein
MLVFLLQLERVVLGDFNQQLIDTYRTVARAPRAVAAKWSEPDSAIGINER